MKIISRGLFFGLLFFSSLVSYGQAFTVDALIPTVTNENGDPQINIVDPNGARQGEWFYQDKANVLSVKEQYQDNNLQQSFIQVASNQTPVWVNFSAFNTSNEYIIHATDYLKQKLNNHAIDWDFSQVVIFRYNGELNTRFIGAWNSEQMAFLLNEISNYFNATTNELPTNFKVILS